MYKPYTLLLLCFLSVFAKAQTEDPVKIPPYGKIDLADLEMTSCDFEKDANAEVSSRVHDFYKKMYELMSEQIVLKKF